MSMPAYQRIGAVCAIVGSLLNWIANLLHPKDLVAYDSAAHFQTIAADLTWNLDHLLFVVVAALTLWGLIAISIPWPRRRAPSQPGCRPTWR